jgi:hypothetical protein
MPLASTGPEPTFTSHDKLCLLNAGDEMANVEIAIYHADREPVAHYRLTIAPRRIRHVRVNDLIFPEAIPLETAYAAIVRADVPLVVQFSRQDTGHAAMTIAGSMAFPDDAPRLPPGTTEGGTMMPEPIGRKRWAIAEGYIPGWSNGPKAELTSHETACILNAGEQDAQVAITVFFAEPGAGRPLPTDSAGSPHATRPFQRLDRPRADPDGDSLRQCDRIQCADRGPAHPARLAPGGKRAPEHDRLSGRYLGTGAATTWGRCRLCSYV